MNLFLTLLAMYATFLVVDGLWIGLVVKKLYSNELGGLMRDKPKALPGIVFYIFYPLAIWLYCVMLVGALNYGGLELNNAAAMFLWGFGFGLTTYGTYVLTSWSVFKEWKAKVAIPDLLWGGFITGLTAMVGYIVYIALSSAGA